MTAPTTSSRPIMNPAEATDALIMVSDLSVHSSTAQNNNQNYYIGLKHETVTNLLMKK